MESTRARPLQLFVRGGVLHLEDGQSFDVGPDPITLGRDPSCTVVIEDPEVSSVHAELLAVTEGVQLRDLGSTNGTLVGAARVRDAVLVAETSVTLGRTKIDFTPSPKKRVDVGFRSSYGELVGGSPRMRRVFQILERVAATELSVLITGETGTGKELAARALHQTSGRSAGPFVVVDCGSIPASIAEGVLFGHEKGAFTGAVSKRKGALLEANGGTLFLDELGELPVDLQPKLLRALSEGQVRPVGASAMESLDVRVVAATRRDLGAEMNRGAFRSDLFFRIAQVRIELPALRDRADDIPMLIEAMCTRLSKPQAAGQVLTWVQENRSRYDWPGNVRELLNVVSVAAALADDPSAINDVLVVERAEDRLRDDSTASRSPYAQARKSALRGFETTYFSQLQSACGGNISEMARRSGMERHHVRAFLRKLGLRK